MIIPSVLIRDTQLTFARSHQVYSSSFQDKKYKLRSNFQIFTPTPTSMTQRAQKCCQVREKGPKAEEGFRSRMGIPGKTVSWESTLRRWEGGSETTFPHNTLFTDNSNDPRLLGGQGSAYHHQQHHHYPYLGASVRHPFPIARKVFTNHRCTALKKIIWSLLFV